jgi:hypothetical protein
MIVNLWWQVELRVKELQATVDAQQTQLKQKVAEIERLKMMLEFGDE